MYRDGLRLVLPTAHLDDGEEETSFSGHSRDVRTAAAGRGDGVLCSQLGWNCGQQRALIGARNDARLGGIGIESDLVLLLRHAPVGGVD